MGASLAGSLQAVGDAAVGQQLDAVQGQRWPRTVPDEALAALVFVSPDARSALDVEVVPVGDFQGSSHDAQNLRSVRSKSCASLSGRPASEGRDRSVPPAKAS